MAEPLISWDREPASDSERMAKLQKIADQLSEMFDDIVGEARLTCPCGRNVSLLLAYQCFECGVYFCKPCAGRHFGLLRRRDA